MKRGRSPDPDAAAKRARVDPATFPHDMVREIATRTPDVATYLALARVCRAWTSVLGDVVSVVEHVLRTATTAEARLGPMRVVRAADLWPDYRWQQLTQRADATFATDVVRPLTNDAWPAAMCGLPAVVAGGYARAMLLKQCRAAGVARIPPALSEAYADVDVWTTRSSSSTNAIDTFAQALAIPRGLSLYSNNGMTSRIDTPARAGGCFGPVPIQLIIHEGHLDHCIHRCFRNPCEGEHVPKNPGRYSCLFGRHDLEATTSGPAFLDCFDLAAPAVAFNDWDVWLTPLAAYAMLTGRCVVADHCPTHAPPWHRPYGADAPHHYRHAEWRLLQRVAKYAALGYTIVEHGLCCVAPGAVVDPTRALPLLDDVAALVARGRTAVNDAAGVFPTGGGVEDDDAVMY
jgi:hypothetical protein